MASSQIEMSSPFGHALRSSLRDRWINRDSKSNASAFQNFKDFVESFSGQPNRKSPPPHDVCLNDVKSKNTKNNEDQISHADLFVHIPTYKNKQNDENLAKNDENLAKNDENLAKETELISSNDCMSQSDVKSKSIKNDEVQISHADLYVHIPTYKKKRNDEKLAKNDENLAKETELISSNDCMPQRSQSQNHGGGSALSTPVRNAEDKAKGGVSSLVRRWRDFEAEAKNSANNSPMTSRANSVESSNMNNSVDISENGDNESLVDGFGDQEQPERVVSRGRESDVVENEKMRVKELIHKLTSTAAGVASGGASDENGNGNEANSPSASSGSPRLRGRHAFGDFLMVMQKDRHNELDGLVERKAVSRFSQKGRIQAMLRVQLLRGAMEAKDARRSNATSLEVNRTPQSAIKRLSERFKPVSQNSAPELKSLKKEVADSSKVKKSTSVQDIKRTHQQEVASPAIPRKEAENTENKESVVKSVIVEEKKPEEKSIVNAASSGNVHENTQNKEGVVKSIVEEEKSILTVASSGDVDEESFSRPDVLQERTNQENKSCSLSKSVETWVPPTEVNEVCSTDGDKNLLHPSGISVDMQENQQSKETSDHRRNEGSISQEEWEEVLSNQYLTESENGWVSDVSHTQVGWEELHSDYERQEESSQDWIWDVSRPRSEWEGLRKERYEEMLDPFKQKEDIRRLLESKSVSGFLSSGLRDRIDRLMISRTQKQLSTTGSQTDGQEVEVGVEEEKVEYRVEREHEVQQDAIEEAERGDAGYYEDDEDDEDEIEVKQQYEESVEYADQTPSTLPFAPCNTHIGPQTSNCSDQVEFSPLQQNSTPNSCFQDSRPPSSTPNQCLIDMQLIYELKGHMEKLHQEVFEIRKSMKSCISMQNKLQRSVKQDVVAALSHSGKNRGRHPTRKKGLTNRSMCCICNDDQVDSLMYRCGHMCTCFKCAHELQRGSGRCPVCQAPILDIVRVKANS